MNAVHSKIPCAVVFANFFLLCAGLLSGSFALYGQSFLSGSLPALPDASGKTTIAGTSFRASPALSPTDSSLLGVWITPSRFGLQELTSGELLFARAEKSFALGCTIIGLGNSLYNELSTTGFFGLPVSETFEAGAALEYTRLAIRDAPVLTAVQVHLGAVLHITPDVSAGVALHNLTRAGFDTDGQSIDQRALLSLGLNITPATSAAAGVQIRLNRASSLLLSLLHTINTDIQLRVGVQTWPRSAEGGIAWNVGDLTFQGMLYYHDELGFSQQLGALYHW